MHVYGLNLFEVTVALVILKIKKFGSVPEKKSVPTNSLGTDVPDPKVKEVGVVLSQRPTPRHDVSQPLLLPFLPRPTCGLTTTKM